jgi:branched-subunit amino acid ABC-type transport system permease component
VREYKGSRFVWVFFVVLVVIGVVSLWLTVWGAGALGKLLPAP